MRGFFFFFLRERGRGKSDGVEMYGLDFLGCPDCEDREERFCAGTCVSLWMVA